MDIRVGDLRINISALALYQHDDNPPLGRYITRLHQPRTVWKWDCVTQTSVPPQRFPIFEIETNIYFLVTRKGRIDRMMSQFLTADAVKTANLASTAAFDREFQKAIPPLQVPIDYATLADPYLGAYSFDIMARITFLQCVARPYGMDIRDYFYVFVPHLVTFTTVITGSCGGALPVGTAVTGTSPHIVPETVLGPLERQIMAEEAEAEARAQRELEEDMLEWGLNPSHSDGLFPDSDSPEPAEPTPEPSPETPPGEDTSSGSGD